MTPTNDDRRFIQQCFDLALEAEGRTSPNPIVGAVVVSKDGEVVGKGFHPKAGEPHAEVFALDEAGEKARGGTIYVSLEPCCHHGKTPPCTDQVIASGVKKVVAAMTDPNPKVAGVGFEKLRAAGIEVVEPVLEEKARWHNRAFIKVITTGMPWVTLKLASTLDGKIADRTGTSKWITGPEARKYVHELRNRMDCVLIGAATARLDNPELNVRDIYRSRNPKRAVIDPNLTIDPASRLCDASTGGDTIIYCSEQAQQIRYPSTVQVVRVPKLTEKLDLQHILKDLKSRQVSSVLCEGGGNLAGALLAENLVDELIFIIAPAILGDEKGTPSIASGKEIRLNDMKRFSHLSSTVLGEDTVIHMKNSS
ncbi:MAG: bifunctional diaminohydroxyphosphoribosylaminopyrimidine deaminase/5-amino-6-(5-phosphoribosylamino)uracil reductase RibD [Candidatus Melainabacteria bacterium]|nr:bifunctional diaminohydroxyphosphoribosylaminopyrimidine deaminase/5-amino-6-(5-phosphoribosylamino)uracil reductase RibD [Candidatus Melainabacteria bacterium]